MTAPSTPTDSRAEAAALALGDDALVLSHRLGEWAGHAPVLEEEVALANIALDLLGQARILLSSVSDEDQLAYLREERAFRNLQLVEQPNGDFAHTIARQLYFSTYQHLLYGQLAASDGELAPLAAEGRQGGRLSPGPRRAVDPAPRRRHSRKPRPDAARPRHPVAIHRRDVPAGGLAWTSTAPHCGRAGPLS
ncbi:hypothetical protein SALBM135S_01815 [Streptomyces alboniger]